MNSTEFVVIVVVTALAVIIASFKCFKPTLGTAGCTDGPVTARRVKSNLQNLTRIEDIRDLLRPQAATIPYLLYSRAKANARLRGAFVLTNTFVTDKVLTHKNFTSQARALLKHEREDWLMLQETALEAVNINLRAQETSMPFEDMVQTICLYTIIIGLLGGEAQHITTEGLLSIAKDINSLWKLSKQPTPIPPKILTNLNSNLHISLPAHENPLNWVIPTWEALWRVVAVTVAQAIRNPEARDSFADFFAAPSKQQFSAARQVGPTPKSFILECMRLYPPTARIKRAVLSHQLFTHLPACTLPYIERIYSPVYKIIDADIEAAQRCPESWGADANEFRPDRWDGASSPTGPFFAFGFGPLQCVARNWAPIAVGVIASTILDATDGREWKIKAGESVGGREGWIGWEVVRV